MAGIFPLSRMQQFDKDTGLPMSGGLLYLFQAGTNTPLNAYKDFGLTVQHSFPIQCDAAGRLPMIFLADGSYKMRFTSKTGVVQFSDDQVPVTGPSSGGGGGGGGVDPDAIFKTRDIKLRWDNQPLSGYVRLNGRTIGNATSGANERANADTQSLFEELWAFDSIIVVGGKGANAVDDYNASKQLTLPDLAGRLLGGMGNMGDGDKGRITSANLGSDPTVLGANGGVEAVTLSKTQLPVLGLQANVTENPHDHGLTYSQAPQSGSNTQCVTTIEPTGLATAKRTTAEKTNISVSIPEVGGGAAHTNLPPLMLLMIYVRL